MNELLLSVVESAFWLCGDLAFWLEGGGFQEISTILVLYF